MRRFAALIALWCTACVEPGLAPPDQTAGVDAGPFVCSPLTCTGCCQENECLGGNEQAACGYDGRACQVCPETTACVTPGACVSRPREDAGTPTTPRRDGGQGTLYDPLTGRPLEPPNQPCYFLFGRFFCG